MDRSFTGKNKKRYGKVGILLVWLGLSIFLIVNGAYGKDLKSEKEVTLETEKIYGTLEKPKIVFPVKWKSPEIINIWKGKEIGRRDFKKEIMKPLDLFELNN